MRALECGLVGLIVALTTGSYTAAQPDRGFDQGSREAEHQADQTEDEQTRHSPGPDQSLHDRIERLGSESAEADSTANPAHNRASPGGRLGRGRSAAWLPRDGSG